MNNKELTDKYPWLKIRNVWTGEEIEDTEFTWADDIPKGWRIAFGDQMIEELDQILRKANYQNDYHISQIKEKWGFIHWYANGVPITISKEYYQWESKYEELSKHTCLICGKPGEIDYNEYWLEPLCEECYKKFKEKGSYDIEE